MKLQMKILLAKNIFILFLILINLIEFIICSSENCLDPCLSCQNSLYYLKFRGDADCKFNRCPGLVKIIVK